MNRLLWKVCWGQRKLTTGEIQKRFDGKYNAIMITIVIILNIFMMIGFGLEPQFAQHTLMGALSGGQKVKVVLGAGL